MPRNLKEMDLRTGGRKAGSKGGTLSNIYGSEIVRELLLVMVPKRCRYGMGRVSVGTVGQSSHVATREFVQQRWYLVACVETGAVVDQTRRPSPPQGSAGEGDGGTWRWGSSSNARRYLSVSIGAILLADHIKADKQAATGSSQTCKDRLAALRHNSIISK